MVQGRLKRESNPLAGEKAGFTPQHDATGAGEYVNTSPANPLPTKDDLVLAKLTQLEAQIKATNTKLDGTINTQLTGSLEGLSTDDKPEVIEGYSYLEYDVEAQEMNVYKGISGEWRLL